jgi:hypothetical protein
VQVHHDEEVANRLGPESRAAGLTCRDTAHTIIVVHTGLSALAHQVPDFEEVDRPSKAIRSPLADVMI